MNSELEAAVFYEIRVFFKKIAHKPTPWRESASDLEVV
jgi:hypothetical protein